MKFRPVIAILIITGLNAHAQKKTWLIDVNGYLDHQESKETSLNNWQIDLTAGRQISEHWAVGAFITKGDQQFLRADSATYATPSGPRNFLVNIRYHQSIDKFGLWCRYIYRVNKRFFFYTQVSAGVSWLGNEDKFPGNLGYYTPLTTNGLDIQKPNFRGGTFVNVTPAIAMTIFRGFGVHASVGGIKYEHSAVYGFDSYNRITVDFSKQFSLGVQKIINTKGSRRLAEIKNKKTS